MTFEIKEGLCEVYATSPSVIFGVLSCACRQLSVFVSAYTPLRILRNSISVLFTLLLLLLLLLLTYCIYCFGLTQYLS
jgi:hypothetical protein